MGVTSVRLNDDKQDRLEQTAARLRRPKAWVINEALDKYLENDLHSIERLEDLYIAIEQAKAGQLIDGEAVLAWIASWGTDNELDPPEIPDHW